MSTKDKVEYFKTDHFDEDENKYSKACANIPSSSTKGRDQSQTRYDLMFDEQGVEDTNL